MPRFSFQASSIDRPKSIDEIPETNLDNLAISKTIRMTVERQKKSMAGRRRSTAMAPMRTLSSGVVPTLEIRAPPSFRTKDKEQTMNRLDEWYKVVKSQILQSQNATSGLFPRYSTDKDVGYVRDSLYCSLAMWALSLGYARVDDDRGRQYELGKSAVKTMRGILFAWMRQTEKVEAFKNNPLPKFALHSKLNLTTGEAIVDDTMYNHLQSDLVALFILVLVEMISSGLEIIFSIDEVNFVQQLVFYIERAYRTPDYGMWEFGTRYNDGTPELHASSLGACKAALEAINGFNLFGNRGTAGSVIYVDIDAHNRNLTTFETLLPRESASKNTDAALISTISYPCFATHDSRLYDSVIEKCVRRLKGQYGFKRFLRDGYGTTVEDTSRRFYQAGETKFFDGIECQWPLFFIYLVIDGVFHENEEQVKKYWELLRPTLHLGEDGSLVVPEYYYVPSENIFHERCHPGSQLMLPSTTLKQGLFLHGQALLIIASLLKEKLVLVSELDPIYQHTPASQRPRFNSRHAVFQGSVADPVVQVALIAESARLQAMLSTYGIQAQTPHQVEPVQIWPPSEMVKVFESLGRNARLKLSGRPARPIGALGTSKFCRVFGDTVLCYPLLFDMTDFYISADPAILIEDIKKDLTFVSQRWKLSGRPTFCIILREEHVTGEHFAKMMDLLVTLKNGYCDSVRVRVGRVQNLLCASCVEHLDFLPFGVEMDFEIKPLTEKDESGRVYASLHDLTEASCALTLDADFNIEPHKYKSSGELKEMLKQTPGSAMQTQGQILYLLYQRHGYDFSLDDGSVRQALDRLCRQAVLTKNWQVVRFCAALLHKVVDSLAPSVTSILVRGKRLTIGVFGHEEVNIDKPVTPKEIDETLFRVCFPHDVIAAVFEQELILALGHFANVEPALFAGMLRLRIGWLIHAMGLFINCEQDEAKSVYDLSPTEVKTQLHDLLTMKHFNRLSPLQQRQLNGSLNRVPPDFYDRMWKIMERTPGGIVVCGYHLPQQPTLSDMTEYELNFALTIEDLLSRVATPEYRQIMVELFMVISLILQRNPELRFAGKLDMDDLVHEAFQMFARDKHLETTTDMTSFYALPSHSQAGTAAFLAKAAVNTLLDAESAVAPTGGNIDSQCTIS